MAEGSIVFERVAVSYWNAGICTARTGPVSVAWRPGARIGIIGPSGCGKTTLLRAAAGLLEAEPAQPAEPSRFTGAKLDGTVLLPAATVVSMMFQETVLLPHATVLDNVLLPFLGRASAINAEDRERARDLLAQMGLKDHAAQRPAGLSGGMATRVGLARALITRPSLLLLDEPFNGLDVGMRERAHQQISRLGAATTVALVTHNLDEAHRLCERVMVLAGDGQLKEVVETNAGTYEGFRRHVIDVFMAS